MYGSRNIPLMPVLIAFLAGWLFAQVFTIAPKDSLNLNPKNASVQRSR